MELLDCITSGLKNILKRGFTKTSFEENYVSICLIISEYVRLGVQDQVTYQKASQIVWIKCS